MELAARIAPFFLLIALGALAGRLKLIDESAGRGLAAYTFWIGFPALLIHWLGKAPAPDASVLRTVAVYAGAMGLGMVVAHVVGRLAGWSRPAVAGAAACAAVGNTAFLGAPVAVALLGESARGMAAALVAVDFTLMTALAAAGLGWAGGGRSLGRSIAGALVNPTVAGAALGVTLALTGWRLWAPVDAATAMLAATASPVALVALGALIGRQPMAFGGGDAAPIGMALVLKLAIAPALVWLAMQTLGTTPVETAVAVLLAACPTAVNIFVQTRAAGVFEQGAARAIAIGTVLSLASLTVLAGLLTP